MLKGNSSYLNGRLKSHQSENQLYEWNDRARDARVNEAVIYQLTHYRAFTIPPIILP